MFKKLLCFIIFLAFSCASYAKENVDWLFYVYLCGSDLESQGGAATNDLTEMLEAKIPANSTVLVCTGGARVWQNETVSARSLQIFRINDKNEINLVGEDSYSNMGDPETLEVFLNFGEENFSPNKRAIIFWDHGGGPAGGVCYDEIADGDFLSMPEITEAFKAAYGSENPDLFEIIGFDACLMANLETSFYMSKWGKYLVASEELEPGFGWYYTGWLSSLAKNPNVSGLELGKYIADSYLSYSKQADTEDVTLSVVDLHKASAVHLAFMDLGFDLIDEINSNDRSVFTSVERSAQNSEKYGASANPESIDLMNFAKNLNDSAKTNALVSSLSDAVVYKVNGRYRRSNGLAMYYPLKKDREKFRFVLENGFLNPLLLLNGIVMGENSKSFFDKVTSGTETNYQLLSEAARLLAPESVKERSENMVSFSQSVATGIQSIESSDFSIEAELKDLPITIDKDGNSFISLPEKVVDNVATVSFCLSYIEKPTANKDGQMVFIGTDDNIKMDWDKGIFTDQFDNTWAAMDGHLLPLTVSEFTDNYTLYDCEIKVNGVLANMSVAYNYDTEKYSIVSVVKLNKDGVPTRKNITLKNGDKITTIMYYTPLKADSSEEDDDDPEEFDNETFVYDSSKEIENTDLGDGAYCLQFEVTGLNGESVYSDAVVVETSGDDMTTQSLEDFLSDEDGDESE